MSDDITSRPQRVAFRPERRIFPAPPGSPEWVINDIRIGNMSQIPRRFTRMWWRWKVGVAWRRLTWFWPRKPPVTRLI